ncbi:DUF488 domain-containing protein [Dictyobacter kobayashii]|uniref:DUF488 domain-containing protein n=1 Tax=Dictyobacter kobayashii TaxID=2014872 RepID=A0A402AD36_9CHLR|nr:DUF488 domain-containing protein [Dictyobacter kobayashii]GCE16996.1 hypothetical protein KDK_07960 [Dictyobacter kobayashii]
MSDVLATPAGTFLYPIGYAAPGSEDLVLSLMHSYPQALLLDVRLRARSRWFPAWNRRALETRWGERYIHELRFGNVNYQYPRRPIELADPDAVVPWAASLLLQGYHLLVLCACKDYARCHRKVVVERIYQRCVEGVHDASNRTN